MAYNTFTATEILDTPEMREAILRRMDWLKRTYQLYVHTWINSDDVYLNDFLLRETIESCYCDIYRLKFFRGIQQEDIHKQSAFLLKWIAKLRPIQIKEGCTDPSKTVLLVNEIFAVCAAISLLGIPFGQVSHMGKYVSNLIYLLHHHSFCTPERLASELYLLEQNHTGSTTTP